jgi:cytochrome c oxidase subunit 4
VSGTPSRIPDHHGTAAAGHAAASRTAEAAAHPAAGPRTYVIVAVFLLAITVMEVWVFYVPALSRVLVPILLILSTLKFALVAMFYMHLKFDHAWFSYVFVGPLLIAIGLAVALLWLFHHLGTTGPGAAGVG